VCCDDLQSGIIFVIFQRNMLVFILRMYVLKMEEVRFSDKLELIYQIIRRHMQRVSNCQIANRFFFAQTNDQSIGRSCCLYFIP
jgi:hypothetical protein